MAANVETMFYTREKLWHGLGTIVMDAPSSGDALILVGLDWKVIQEPIYTDTGEMIPGYKANVRDSDRKTLGVVMIKLPKIDTYYWVEGIVGRLCAVYLSAL